MTSEEEKDAWREVDKLGLLLRINDDPGDVRIRFNALAEHYLKADFGDHAVRPKSENTIIIAKRIVRDYLVSRWGDEIAEDIKPLDIQCWFRSLHVDSGLAWTTIPKMRGVISRIYKVGMLHDRVSKNPVLNVETRAKTNYDPLLLRPLKRSGFSNL